VRDPSVRVLATAYALAAGEVTSLGNVTPDQTKSIDEEVTKKIAAEVGTDSGRFLSNFDRLSADCNALQKEGTQIGGIVLRHYREQAQYAVQDQRNQDDKNAEQVRYKAVLSCGGRGGHINILPCLMGENRVSTELELQNGTSYEMFKGHEIRQAGTETSSGFVIDLKKRFELKVQNAHSSLVLNLRIIDIQNGAIVFEKSVSRFGRISVSN
jgi:hypothetical protein